MLILVIAQGVTNSFADSTNNAGEIDSAESDSEFQRLLEEVKGDDPVSKHAVFAYAFRSDSLSAEQKEIALRLLSEAASDGLEVAQFNLGTLYRYGRWLPQDRELALRWMLMASSSGMLEARIESADLLYILAVTGEAGNKPGEYLQKSVESLRQDLERDDLNSDQELKAKTILGRSITYVDPYDAEGWRILSEAACAGNGYAQSLLRSGTSSFVKAQIEGDSTASNVLNMIELGISQYCTAKQIEQLRL